MLAEKQAKGEQAARDATMATHMGPRAKEKALAAGVIEA